MITVASDAISDSFTVVQMALVNSGLENRLP